MNRPLRIGIIGSGLIVPEFLYAAKLVAELDLTAICGREKSIKRLEELATKFEIPKIYLNYDEMLASADIDAVYVAVPNNLHFDFAQKALLKNKHVILEKPFAASYPEACALVDLAKAKDLFLFEAISNQYLPNYAKIKALLAELGDLKIVQINYSQYSRRYDLFKQGIVQPVFDPKMSGGALMDLNVYNIHLILGLFGKPTAVSYHANIEKGIDTSGILFLDYPTFKCAAIAAKDCKAPVSINIQGDRGCIHSDSPANKLDSFVFEENSGASQKYALNEFSDRLYYELVAFQEMCAKNDLAFRDTQLQQTLDVMAILDEARKQAGIAI